MVRARLSTHSSPAIRRVPMWIPSPEPPQRLLRRKHSGDIFSAELQNRLDGLQDFITLEAVFYDGPVGADQDDERYAAQVEGTG